MKKQLVYALFYDGDLIAVCRTRSKAREIAKQHVIDLDSKVDKFFLISYPLL